MNDTAFEKNDEIELIKILKKFLIIDESSKMSGGFGSIYRAIPRFQWKKSAGGSI